MDKNWGYKNFNMVLELNVAGEFIYNGIHEINRLNLITNDAPTFTALYNVSVGIERLQKIVLVLWKLTKDSNEEEFEKSLITHRHAKLRDEIIKYTNRSKNSLLNDRENDFISLIQEFYKTCRYLRFDLSGEKNHEGYLFEKYLRKYLDISKNYPANNGIIATEEIKEFLGRVIGNICFKYYQLIKEGSELNSTFTYELRFNSKAEKIFYSNYRKKSLMESQVEERLSFKEIIIYIRNAKEKNAFLKFLDGIEPLDFDPTLVIEYLQEMSEGIFSQSLIDNVKTLYDENELSIERANLVELIGNSRVLFDYPDIVACNDILVKILNDKKVNDKLFDCLNEHMCYLQDDEVVDVLSEFNKYYKIYKKDDDIATFLIKTERIKNKFKIFLMDNDKIN